MGVDCYGKNPTSERGKYSTIVGGGGGHWPITPALLRLI
jgi:hypothetical protein